MTISPASATSGSGINGPVVLGADPGPTVASPTVEGNPPAPAPTAPVAPEPTAPAPVPPTAPDPAGAPPDPAADPVPEPDPAAPTPEVVDPTQKRMNELTAKRYAAEREARAEKEARLLAERQRDEAIARAAGVPPGTAPTPDPRATLPEEEIERRALEKATQLAAQKVFNDTCNAVADTGRAEFKADWDQALHNLNLVGAIGQGVSPEFLETAIELQSPHKVLHYLGTNLDEAERIVKLPAKRMALELARVEAKLNAPAPAPVAPPPPPVSRAPAPVIPVGGAATPPAPTLDDPNLSTEDFMRLRAEQQDARRRRYLR